MKLILTDHADREIELPMGTYSAIIELDDGTRLETGGTVDLSADGRKVWLYTEVDYYREPEEASGTVFYER